MESSRNILAGNYGEQVAKTIRMLYGGSVNHENAREFFEDTEIDGALVGGASLKDGTFSENVKAAYL